MIDLADITDLLEIAERAIEVRSSENSRRAAREQLTIAYVDWKDRNCTERVERDTLEWVQMMEATKSEYVAFDKAKRAERNARRRLDATICRYEGRKG